MVGAVLALLSVSAYAQKLDVTIIDRQDHSETYTYVVPGYSNSNSYGTVNCFGAGNTTSCSGSSSRTGLNTPGYGGSYEVRGATLSLRLPDGRIVVVNCDSKINWKNPRLRRDCRVPLGNEIHAIFRGDHVKLEWPVSLNGRKMRHETYTILVVLDKKRSDLKASGQNRRASP